MNLSTKVLEYVNAAKYADFSLLESISGTTENSLRVTINRLVKHEKLYNPIRGVYVAKDADPFWVAASLFPGYISLSSAFYLNNLIDEYPFIVFVASETRRSIKMGGHEFIYFKAKNYLGVEEGKYKIASVEKAIYDSLLHIDMVGIPALAKALYYAKISSRKFMQISNSEGGAFFQRLGYLISILPDKDIEKKKLMAFCAKRIRANAYLQGRNSGRYVKEWKIIDNVDKEVFLAWLHQ
ncbi:MAG: type IV toxin-antitoxin system AbiEi family antitoxin domain-containing protein [Candidatus Micrarchaeaceae archaeon]